MSILRRVRGVRQDLIQKRAVNKVKKRLHETFTLWHVKLRWSIIIVLQWPFPLILTSIKVIFLFIFRKLKHQSGSVPGKSKVIVEIVPRDHF